MDTAAGLRMVGGDDETPPAGLNADAGAGRVPGPIGPLDAGGDLDGHRPRHAVVHGVHRPDGATRLARAGEDVLLAIGAAVVRRQQPERAGRSVEDRTGIAERVRAIVADDLQPRPGLSAVTTALHDEVDVAGVARTDAPGFSEGEERPGPRGDDRRDPEGVITGFAGHVDVGEPGSSERRLSRGEGAGAQHDGGEPRTRSNHASVAGSVTSQREAMTFAWRQWRRHVSPSRFQMLVKRRLTS